MMTMQLPGLARKLALPWALVLLLSNLALAEPALRTVAPGVRVQLGEFVPGRQPDGNSVLIEAPEGLIVVDSGRHASHTDALIALAKSEKTPIAALINSHWHLDHISGNPRIRAAFPDVVVYASQALHAARAGFLADYRKQLAHMVEQSEAPEAQKDSWREEIARIDAGDALEPDQLVLEAQTVTIAGKSLQLGLEKDSVTGGDVWIFDSSSGVLIAGDLVTLPVPFLDTACAGHWQDSLKQLAKVDFVHLIPGHGESMNRAGFTRYQLAFDRLLDCAASDAEQSVCAEQWRKDLGELLPESESRRSDEMLAYYVDQVLRGPKADQYCPAQG